MKKNRRREKRKKTRQPRRLLPTLSAEEVHKNLVRLRRLGSRIQAETLKWAYVLIQQGHADRLGASSPFLYLTRDLEYGKSEAYAIIVVASKLPSLPRSIEALDQGKISWDKLKAFGSIAKRKTEKKWLSFAMSHTADEVRAEAKDAEETGRKLPRKNGSSLLNRKVKMVFLLSLEEREYVVKGLEASAEDILESREGMRKRAEEEDDGEEVEQDGLKRPSPEESLLHLCKGRLARGRGGARGKGAKEHPFCGVLYRACPICRESAAMTGKGPVEVPWEKVQEIAKRAWKANLTMEEEMVKGELLPPGKVEDHIPAGVRMKVLAVYGNACVHCGMKLGIHIHHVVFKCRGGPNEVWNLIPLCPHCHKCIHDGTLEVFWDSLGHLHWRTMADRINLLLEDELKELAAIPSVTIPFEKESEEEEEEEEDGEGVPREGGGGEAKPSDPPQEAEAAGASAREEPAPASAAAPSSGNGAVGCGTQAPENGTVRSPESEEVKREATGVFRVLVEKLGHEKEEARKLVGKAVRLLGSLGRAPTGDEILNTALHGRPIVIRGGRFSGVPERGSPSSRKGGGCDFAKVKNGRRRRKAGGAGGSRGAGKSP